MKKSSIGENIRKVRLDLGMTMNEFIIAIDGQDGKGSRVLVSNWERNKHLPNKKRLKKIAELGNTTIDELVNSNEVHKSLTIWFHNGQNIKFKDVKIIEESKKLIFTYFSQSDLVQRKAEFDRNCIAGYAFG
ncbi:helix-turn-helix domain-containing protein [Ligilactobacillus sp. WILCCON 0076]|uniref:Helix-turn-helix domain-containing protein n=1 Tax=Ligilactobacillus ubinensis TaxID=2876789 RepID=A0A9X2FKC2_9LACO|nr:helix-turn-helix transcriptional regulator [Ligilactobacillus ubinensis]MCP0886940.1 helix-turn-helix domain-containing protein [Ligilactobacillus ubinensis]